MDNVFQKSKLVLQNKGW